MTASSVPPSRPRRRARQLDHEWCDVDTTASVRLRAQLVHELPLWRSAGRRAWHGALMSVPRHHFAPRAHLEPPGWPRSRQRFETTEREWLRTVYSDRPLTVRTGSAVAADVHGTLVLRPSATQCLAPSAVLTMLAALDVAPGGRVLHLEGGTGYVTALLAARLTTGTTGVLPTTQACWSARMRLGDLDLFPRMRPAPAAAFPGAERYDAVLSTVPCPSVPWAWVRQLAPGGRLVCVLDRRSAVRPVLSLTARPAGVAEGRFSPLVLAAPPSAAPPPVTSGPVTTARRSAVRPEAVHDPTHPFAFFTALRLPGLQHVRTSGAELFHTRDGSWARIPAVTGQVEQGGPRDLWSDVEQCHRRWTGLGRPEPARFGVTVTPRGSSVWLDGPGNELWTRRHEVVR